MKIAVIGSGAIGGLVAGYLKTKGLDVVLVGHRDSVEAIRSGGLHISGVRGDFHIELDAEEKLKDRPDLAILAVKSQDIDSVFRDNLDFLSDTWILTSQNGIQADKIAACYVDKARVLSSIVMFGSTYLEPGKIVHNFEGSWVIGRFFGAADDKAREIGSALSAAFPVLISDQIRGMKYLKIFVNANNCIPAILGVSMQEAFADPAIGKVSIAIWKEGLSAISGSVELVSLPDFPVERLTKLASLPLNEAGAIFSGIMKNLSREPLYGSILQSLKRNRVSEIDYINGELVRMAEDNNRQAPLNKKLVSLVHQVEKERSFLTKERFLEEISGLMESAGK